MKKVILSLLVLALIVAAFAFAVNSEQLAANIDGDSQLAAKLDPDPIRNGMPGSGAGNEGSGGGIPGIIAP